jgi:hypothetical protein
MSKYANQTLHDPKTGQAVDIQVEFTEHEIIARHDGKTVATIKCEAGAACVNVPPLTSGHEPEKLVDHAKVIRGDK